MSELFEEEDDIIDLVEDFEHIVKVDTQMQATSKGNLDARRRLEQVLEEKRLRNELDDFVDYCL